jgi:F420-non-reducing hydrogenase iron-sulfur subunit
MTEFRPHIVAFVCAASGFAAAGADAAPGFPAGVRLVSLPCIGRLDPQFVLAALTQGADAVLVLGCAATDCRHASGSNAAALRMALLNKFLSQSGIPAQRVRWGSLPKSDAAAAVAHQVAEMTAAVRELGPLNITAQEAHHE